MNSQKKNSQKKSDIRIIAGKWRSRKLYFYNSQGLRPTLNHMRETLFNWLQFDVEGKQVLDLFAGSAALGIEALSRGAKHATFVELSHQHAKQIKDNLNALGDFDSEVLAQDALNFIKATTKPYDLVFLDPPFNKGLLSKLIPELDKKIAQGTFIYLEHEIGLSLNIPSSWQGIKQKQTKEFCASLYKKV